MLVFETVLVDGTFPSPLRDVVGLVRTVWVVGATDIREVVVELDVLDDFLDGKVGSPVESPKVDFLSAVGFELYNMRDAIAAEWTERARSIGNEKGGILVHYALSKRWVSMRNPRTAQCAYICGTDERGASVNMSISWMVGYGKSSRTGTRLEAEDAKSSKLAVGYMSSSRKYRVACRL